MQYYIYSLRHILLLIIFLPLQTTAQSTASLDVEAELRINGIHFSDDNSVVLLESGQEKFDDMFECIRQAKSSVHLEYFNFRNDSIASLLFDILAEKAKQGVEIRALFDAFGNSSNNQPLKANHIKSIRERGIEIFEFDPIKFPWINHIWSRDHRKIVVIDGRIAYTGGMNVADYYINGTEVVGEWHDMHCRIEGSEVATLQSIFLNIWNKTAKQNISGQKYFPQSKDLSYFSNLKPDTTTSAHRKRVGIINREPHRSPKIVRTFYLSAINNARDSIKLINPYFTLNSKLKRALKRAVQRGVKVEIMVSKNSDIPLTPDCGFYNVHQLMKAGATIWIYEGGFHHTKIIMVDGELCTVGSANLNARSLRFDYESNAVILDKETTQQLDNLFERDKRSRSFRLTQKSWNAWRTPWTKFRGWFAHLLAPWL